MGFERTLFAVFIFTSCLAAAKPVPPALNWVSPPPKNFPFRAGNEAVLVGAGLMYGYEDLNETCVVWKQDEKACLNRGGPGCPDEPRCCIMVPSASNGGNEQKPWINCYGDGGPDEAKDRWMQNSTMYSKIPVPLQGKHLQNTTHLDRVVKGTGGDCICPHYNQTIDMCYSAECGYSQPL